MSFEHPVGKNNREKVIQVIIDLGGERVSPKQIKVKLDQKAVIKVENFCKAKTLHLSESEKLEKIKKATMSERAMFSGLEILTQTKMLDNENGLYSLSEKMKSDPRFLPRSFAGSALAKIMNTHYPTINTLEHNFEELIKLFGSFIVYCFMEAARAVNIDSMNNFEKDKLASSWIQKVFSPLDMYNYFLAAMKNQPDEEEVKKIVKTKLKKIKKNEYIFANNKNKTHRPPSTQDFAEEHFLALASEFDHSSHRPGKPLYELPEETIKRLGSIFERKYPIIYEQLLDTREDFFGRPKEQSLPKKKKKNKHTSFDFSES